ncbi:MAG: ribosomal-processing cysteine protease Prp [Clostridia bacterium]
MTKVVFLIKDDALVGFSALGHTGFSYEGTDIVCAAISALTQTGLIAISDIAKCSFEHRLNNGGLFLRLDGKNNCEALKKADLILRTIRLGLISIEKKYEEYLNVTTEEV